MKLLKNTQKEKNFRTIDKSAMAKQNPEPKSLRNLGHEE